MAEYTTDKEYIYKLELENHVLKEAIMAANKEVELVNSLLSKQIEWFDNDVNGMLMLKDTEDSLRRAEETIKYQREVIMELRGE